MSLVIIDKDFSRRLEGKISAAVMSRLGENKKVQDHIKRKRLDVAKLTQRHFNSVLASAQNLLSDPQVKVTTDPVDHQYTFVVDSTDATFRVSWRGLTPEWIKRKAKRKGDLTFWYDTGVLYAYVRNNIGKGSKPASAYYGPIKYTASKSGKTATFSFSIHVPSINERLDPLLRKPFISAAFYKDSHNTIHNISAAGPFGKSETAIDYLNVVEAHRPLLSKMSYAAGQVFNKNLEKWAAKRR